ncbi:MAG: hypothetical protein HXN16_00095 [Porphyromonas sp.]|uniref:Gp37-like protein n=1 Tax=Porphyromonas sp. TaxID=1924944 RepID=UPI001CAC63A7|nr:hypothetical protein [Porphyromonas sp.]MBF1389144.1 hypothetical protein [Porphyromonas sp.]
MVLQHICEDYKSVIWTERFHGFGDFKLTVPGTLENLQIYQLDYYLYTKGTNKLMIIEQVELNTEYSKQSMLTVSGRSLESILDRRVMHPYPIWEGTRLCMHERTKGKVKDVIKHYTNLLFKQRDSLDTSHERHVTGFGWYSVDELPNGIRKGRPVSSMDIGNIRANANGTVRNMTRNADYSHAAYDDTDPYIMEGSWYKLVQNLTDLTMSGWAIEHDGEDPYYWYGYTYNGVNRTFNQGERPPVVFSPKYDNLSKATYFKSKVSTRTKIFSGAVKFTVPLELQLSKEYLDDNRDSAMQNNSVTVGTRGLGLREGYFQSPSIEHTNGYMISKGSGQWGVASIDPESIYRQIHEQCNTELWRHMPLEMFSGEAAQQSMYTYNEDFFLGDFVQIQNEFGQQDIARVTEYIRTSSDSEGDVFYPTFESLSDIQKSKPGLNIT